MASNLKITTEEGIEELKRLLDELEKLQESIKKVGTFGKRSFKDVQKATEEFNRKTAEINDQIKNLTPVILENAAALEKSAAASKKNSDSKKQEKGAYDQLAESVKKAKKAAQDSATTTGKQSEVTKKLTQEYNNLKKKLDEATISQNKNTQAKEKNTSAGKGMLRMMGSLMSAVGFLGIIALIGQTIKSIISLTIKFQSLGYAIDKIAGENFAEIKRSWEFLIELNQNFGARLSDTTERWLKFRAAASQSNITLKDTMDIFRSVTKASAVLGLGSEELKGVYLALEQMLSKGKVTTEELRRQLGERLPGAMGIMAKAIGVSINELDKMMKKGEVLSSYALPRFAKALEEAYGIESLKTVENLATGVGKMAGAWDLFVLTISEGDSIISKAIGGTMKLITATLNQMTYFLETYNQTANRTSGKRYGKTVAREISREIEERINLNKTIKQTEWALKDELRALEKIAAATLEGTAEREAAIKNIMVKSQELSDFQKKKADEGNLLSIEKYDIELENLKKIEKARDEAAERAKIERPKNISGEPIAVQQKIYAEYAASVKDANSDLKNQNEAYVKQLEYVKQLNELRKSIGGLVEPEEDKKDRGRKIREMREFIETNELLINELKERIRLNERLNELEVDDRTGAMDRLFDNAEMSKKIADLTLEDQLNANQLWKENEEKKLNENLHAHKNNAENLAKQEEENRKQRLENEKEFQHKNEIAEQAHRETITALREQDDDKWLKVISSRYAYEQTLAERDFNSQIYLLNERLSKVRKGSNEEKRILREIEVLSVQFFNNTIDRNIAEEEYQLSKVKSLEEEEAILIRIENLKNSKRFVGQEDNKTLFDSDFTSYFTQFAGASQNLTNELAGFLDQQLQNRIDKIDREIEAEERKYDRLLELAKGDAEETKIIERNKALAMEKLEAKRRKEIIKQAKLDKALKISQAITGTAVAVVNMLGTVPWPANIAMAALAAAAGAVQIATIASTPIPEFAKGGVMDKDGKALINDGGKQEYIERGGKILTTGKSNALVDLKAGDIIHKDYDTLKRKSMLLSLNSGGQTISEKELNLAFGIKEEIREGFKKAKVNSNVTVLNQTNSYRERMSMWGN